MIERSFRALLAPAARRILRRDEGEIARQARRFHIVGEAGRRLVDRLGRAFLGGYNAMLDAPDLDDVVRRGEQVETHFRPFFFEGAAMGYLPRGWWDVQRTPGRFEADLVGRRPEFLFLYYVGLGFWYAFRHPRDPGRIAEVAGPLNPLYFPLCYDGFGFKVGFFDFSRRPAHVRRLDAVPEPYRRQAYQGFGRAMFFVCMDDAGAFDRIRDGLPAEFHQDVELGRALATGFTGTDRPAALLTFVAGARDEPTRAARLVGLTWALTARERTDRGYLEDCIGRVGEPAAAFLRSLPELCNRALSEVSDYTAWQERTRVLVSAAYRDARDQLPRGA